MKTFFEIANPVVIFGAGLYFFASSIALFYIGKIGLGFLYVAMGIWMWTPPKYDPLFILFDRITRKRKNTDNA